MSLPYCTVPTLFNIDVSEKKDRLLKGIQNVNDIKHFTELELYQLCGFLNEHYKNDNEVRGFGVVWVGQTPIEDYNNPEGIPLPESLDFILFVSCFNNSVFVCFWHEGILVTMNNNPKDEVLQPLKALIKRMGLNVTDTISLDISTNDKKSAFTVSAFFCCVVSRLYFKKRNNPEVIIEKLEHFMAVDGFIMVGKKTIPVVDAMAAELRNVKNAETTTKDKDVRNDLFCFNGNVKMFC